jgi:hypothetical protein
MNNLFLVSGFEAATSQVNPFFQNILGLSLFISLLFNTQTMHTMKVKGAPRVKIKTKIKERVTPHPLQ